MIEDADARLKEWVTSVAGELDVSLGFPKEARTGRAVNLYLLEMLQTPQPRGPKRPPLEVTLRYLVTSSADSPEEAHKIREGGEEHLPRYGATRYPQRPQGT